MTLFHFMPMPMFPADGHGASVWTSVFFFLVWLIPFALAFLWHRYHDHKHNHIIEKKLDQLIDLLKQYLNKR